MTLLRTSYLMNLHQYLDDGRIVPHYIITHSLKAYGLIIQDFLSL